MLFFNDECDLADDDQYDLFTLTSQIERRTPSCRGRARKRQAPAAARKSRRSRPQLAIRSFPFAETTGDG